MLHTRIDLRKFRFIMDQIQNFLPREIITSIEATINLAHEFKIFGSIYCPAVVAKVSGEMEERDLESA